MQLLVMHMTLPQTTRSQSLGPRGQHVDEDVSKLQNYQQAELTSEEPCLCSVRICSTCKLTTILTVTKSRLAPP